MFRSDRLVFIFCLALAAIVWTLQKLKNNYLFTQKYSIEYFLPVGKAFKSEPPYTLEVEMAGTGWDILTKSSKNIGSLIQIELRTDNRQLITSEVIKQNINNLLSSKNIAINKIVPDHLDVELVDQASKKIPVTSKLNISYFPGFFAVEKQKFFPDSVTLTCAPQYFDQIKDWPTEQLTISNLNKSIVDMPISLKLPKSSLIRINKDKVTMNLNVEEFTEKILTVPLRVKNAKQKVKLLPNKIKVTCMVGISKYELTSADDFDLYVDLDENQRSPYVNIAPIHLAQLPSYIKNVKIEPNAAQYFFTP